MDAFVPEVAPPPLLECRDLTKRYGATVALDRFTVSLPAGRIVGLLGPNGSGKTTLLKMIAGVAHPMAGDIRVAGYEVGPESKALVSYLPERPYFSRSMRVREMIAYFADFYEDFDAALARDMLARLGVPEDAPTSALSKGTVEKVQRCICWTSPSAAWIRRPAITFCKRSFAPIGRSRPSSFPPISYAMWRRFWTTSSCCAMARCCCTRPWPT